MGKKPSRSEASRWATNRDEGGTEATIPLLLEDSSTEEPFLSDPDRYHLRIPFEEYSSESASRSLFLPWMDAECFPCAHSPQRRDVEQELSEALKTLLEGFSLSISKNGDFGFHFYPPSSESQDSEVVRKAESWDQEAIKRLFASLSDEEKDEFFERVAVGIREWMGNMVAEEGAAAFPAVIEGEIQFSFLVHSFLSFHEEERRRASAFFASRQDFVDALEFLSQEVAWYIMYGVEKGAIELLFGSVVDEDGEEVESDLHEEWSFQRFGDDVGMREPLTRDFDVFVMEGLSRFLGHPLPPKMRKRVERAKAKTLSISGFLLDWLEGVEGELTKRGLKRGFSDVPAPTLLLPWMSKLRREGKIDWDEADKGMSVSRLVKDMVFGCFPYLFSPEEMGKALVEMTKEAHETFRLEDYQAAFKAYMECQGSYPQVNGRGFLIPTSPRSSSLSPVVIDSEEIEALVAPARSQITNRLFVSEDLPFFQAYYSELEGYLHEFSSSSPYFGDGGDSVDVGIWLMAAAFSSAMGWNGLWPEKRLIETKGSALPSVRVPCLDLHRVPERWEKNIEPPMKTLKLRECKAESFLGLMRFYGLPFLAPEMRSRWGGMMVSSLLYDVRVEELKRLRSKVGNALLVPLHPLDGYVARILGLKDKDLEEWDITNLLCFFSGFIDGLERARTLKRWVESNGAPSPTSVAIANLELPRRDRDELKKMSGKTREERTRDMEAYLARKGMIPRIAEKKEILYLAERAKRLRESLPSEGESLSHRLWELERALESFLFESPSNWCPHLMRDPNWLTLFSSSSLPSLEGDKRYVTRFFGPKGKRAKTAPLSLKGIDEVTSHLTSEECILERLGIHGLNEEVAEEVKRQSRMVREARELLDDM